MSKIFIAIDPGLTGSIAIIEDINTPCFSKIFYTPVCKKKTHKGTMKNEYEVSKIVDILEEYRGKDVLFFIEIQSSRPMQGTTSSFNGGRGFGLFEGIAAGMRFEIVKERPQAWKKYWEKELMHHDTKADGKDAARVLATKICPELKSHFKLKKDDGKAEAFLMAERMRQIYLNNNKLKEE